MLILSRTPGTALIIDGEIVLTVLCVSFDMSEVKIGMTALGGVDIQTEENYIIEEST